jgi:hypothetical protein
MTKARRLVGVGVGVVGLSCGALLFACAGSADATVDTPPPAPVVEGVSELAKGSGGHCSNNSGSGGVGGTSCSIERDYTCSGGKLIDVACVCGDFAAAGTCTCGSKKIAFDCSTRCAAIPTTILSACGVR